MNDSNQTIKHVAPMYELESCEADLEIFLGGGGGGGEEEEENSNDNYNDMEVDAFPSKPTIRRYPSAVVASHSKYVDTMLKTDMKEKRTKRIHFPDISVDLWDLLWPLERDASRAQSMTVEDALAIAPACDKYDFPVGRCLCNNVLTQYLERLETKEHWGDSQLDVNRVLDVLEISLSANLQSVIKAAQSFLKHELEAASEKSVLARNDCCGFVLYLNEELVEKLLPYFLQLLESATPDDPVHILPPHLGCNKDDLTGHLFPKLFVNAWGSHLQVQTGDVSVERINPEGVVEYSETYYIKPGKEGYQAKRRYKLVRKACQGAGRGPWVVVFGDAEVRWHAPPNTENWPFPPNVSGWTTPVAGRDGHILRVTYPGLAETS